MFEWLAAGKATVGALPTTQATDKLLTAMTKFGNIYGNYENFFKDDQGGLTPEIKEALPTWMSVDLRNCLRNLLAAAAIVCGRASCRKHRAAVLKR